MGIEDVLNEPETPAIPAEVPIVETPEPVVEKTTSVRKKGLEREYAAREVKEVKEEPKKEEPKKPEEVPFTDREKAFLARAEDEKRKRQDLESKYRQQPAPQVPAVPEATKTFWDDPEASLKSFQDRLFQEITKSRLNTAEIV